MHVARILSLLIVLFLGLIALSIPFHGDQVIHLLGAKAIEKGGVLYKDFWDLKQPGIFYFYWIGGNVFNFTVVGIHAWELLVFTVFNVFLLVAVRPYFSSEWSASLVPILSVGAYYSVAGPWQLTQIEAVVGIPLFISAWAAAESIKRERRAPWLVATGLGGAMVGFLKFTYLPIWAAFAICALAFLWREPSDKKVQKIVAAASLMALGLIIPLGAAGAYFAAEGLSTILFKTFFLFPMYIVETVPPNYSALKNGLIWYGGHFWPLVAFAIIGIYQAVGEKRKPLLVMMILWVAVGLLMVFGQRMWWAYHYLVLIIPIGVLAAVGLDAVWGSLRQKERFGQSWQEKLTFAFAALGFLWPTFNSGVVKTVYAIRDGILPAGENIMKHWDRYGDYSERRDMVNVLLRDGSEAGDIFVFGDPTLYWLGHRGQAAAVHGWATDGYTREQWEWLARDLENRSPVYIFVWSREEALIRERAPEIWQLIETNYESEEKAGRGQWFRRRSALQ